MSPPTLRFPRPLLGLILCACLSLCAYGQEKVQSCSAGLKIALDGDYIFPSYGSASGIKLQYRVQGIARVSQAWIEIFDGGLQLLRQPVPVSRAGSFTWNHLREVPETPSNLELAIFDPELPLVCTDECSGPSKGGIDFLSMFWAGNSPEEPAPFSLAQASYRLTEGSGWGDLLLDGFFVGPSPKLLLEQQDESGQWLAHEYLVGEPVDGRHMKVHIPPSYLAKPGMLGISSYATGQEPEVGSAIEAPQMKIYVEDRESPVLSSVYPSEVSPDEAEKGPFHIPVRLQGSGFTSASRVVRTLYDVDLAYEGSTRFISPTELQYDMYQDEFVIDHKWTAAGSVRLWVATGDWLHVSEPQEIKINPSPSFPPNPATAQRSTITSVSPYPIPMIDPAGPQNVIIAIHGEHFRKNEIVTVLRDEHSVLKDFKLHTEYLSPQELRVWLPRDLWSEHRLRYRFAVETKAGLCVVETDEDDN